MTPQRVEAETQLAQLPVREVTIFKDGHAFVVHEGTARRDADGSARIAELPTPVIGTFWPFVNDPAVQLSGVAAGRKSVTESRPASTLPDLLRTNVGAKVIIHETHDRSYPATIVGTPRADEPSPTDASTAINVTSSRLPAGAMSSSGSPGFSGAVAGEIILLQTEQGTRSLPISMIREVTFVDPPRQTHDVTLDRELLTLRLAAPTGTDIASLPQEVKVGMAYLQKGLRWIPNYRVTLQPDGQALVELQATLLNELTDLNGVTTHLVIGVPTFEFESTIDPLALDRTLDQLSMFFRKQAGGGAAVQSYLSNSIMLQSQATRMGEYRGGASGGATDSVAPEVGAGDGDLFVFTLNNLTLLKGERMTVPIEQWTVPFESLYRLRIPFTPPQELRQQVDSSRQEEVARLLSQPKVMHIARLRNVSSTPFTTAPVLLMQEGRILAQGMMTYTSPGAEVDLEITNAVNLPVLAEDRETNRQPRQLEFHNNWFQRIGLEGQVTVSNFQKGAVKIEVERILHGTAEQASAEGEIVRPGWNSHRTASDWPDWWRGRSIPWWWQHLNPVSRIRWTQEIPPGGRLELTYKWFYYWG